MTDAHQVVAAYWAAAEARDPHVLGTPTRRRRDLPRPPNQGAGPRPGRLRPVQRGGFHLRLATDPRSGSSAKASAQPAGSSSPGQTAPSPGPRFFDLADDGKIAVITDFWPEPYELPASRAHLVERY